MSTPTVSICIPTYERLGLLQEAIRSCQAQTWRDFEIVITDNSRSDTTEKWVKSIADERVRYYRNPENLGPLKNMMRAMSLAQGKYLKLLMDDDTLKPEALQRQVEAMEKNPDVAVVMAPMELINERGERIFPKFYLFRTMEHRYRYRQGSGLVGRRQLLLDFLTRDYPCCVPSGVLYRVSSIRRVGGMDPQADFAIDLDLATRLAAYFDFYYIDEALSSWRLLPTCYTAELHARGMNIEAFYYITNKTLSLPITRELFPTTAEWKRLVRRSMFFCSCRALLNLPAAFRSRSAALLGRTFRTILQRDPYPSNWMKLPFWVVGQIWISLFPKKLPLEGSSGPLKK